jgi:hypothetical protein
VLGEVDRLEQIDLSTCCHGNHSLEIRGNGVSTPL